MGSFHTAHWGIPGNWAEARPATAARVKREAFMIADVWIECSEWIAIEWRYFFEVLADESSDCSEMM